MKLLKITLEKYKLFLGEEFYIIPTLWIAYEKTAFWKLSLVYKDFKIGIKWLNFGIHLNIKTRPTNIRSTFPPVGQDCLFIEYKEIDEEGKKIKGISNSCK